MISVIDFGSQYTHLLYQAICKLGYEAKLHNSYEDWLSRSEMTSALVLSGGPRSVYEDKTNYAALESWLNSGGKTLGICYGMQLIAHLMGGKVEQGTQGEYGNTRVRTCDTTMWSTVWMSHRDHVVGLPSGAEKSVVTENDLIAGFRIVTPYDEDYNGSIHALQFHPEVKHTENGLLTLGSILQEMGLGNPNPKEMFWLEEVPTDLDHAICAFSGGVDSLVAATYVHKQIGDRLKCLYIDTGLMRPQDDLHIKNLQESLGLNIAIVHAKEQFLHALKGISEPEAKRKAIGKTFIDVFEAELKKLDSRYNYLIQGTIWPDVVESAKTGSGQEVIKSHHNVGGLPDDMNLKIYEPLRNFYKTDVRKYGSVLGIKLDYLNRHPFPGPGLGIRILGEIDEENLRKARESDQILFEELINTKDEIFRASRPSHFIPYYKYTWQAFTVVLPVKTVGVKGDSRSYENVVAIRMVNSEDGMTATWSKFSHEFLSRVSTRIMNEVAGVNRVVYDISNKPCATIEWE